MALSSDDIISRRFTVAPQGYDRSQVLSFLEEVATDYGKLTAAIPSDGLGSTTDEGRFRQLGDHVAEILASATRGADQLRETVAQEAQELRAATLEELARAKEEAGRAEASVRQELERAQEHRASVEREATEVLAAAEARAAETLRAVREEQDDVAELRARVERDAAERLTNAHNEAAAMVEAAGRNLDEAAELRADVEREVLELRESLQRETAEVSEVVRMAHELQALVDRLQHRPVWSATPAEERTESPDVGERATPHIP